ncbi:MAG: FkbM family methyltransferase [Campylobacterales bacterium]|nr:FkbM family methyltransferase [Campylobacterales bacterium]
MKSILKKILPKSAIKFIVNFKNNYLDGYALKSYSQEGEDMILRRIFERQSTGFYVDVGAHHPKRFSNTYYFYRKGWNGINIDAMPGSMIPFESMRSRDINIEKPISSKKQVLTYYAFNEPALNGFSKEISEARDGLNNYKIEFTKDIETSTLEEVLDEKLPSNQVIDFLSIDVEGLDFDVIKSMNIKKYRPRVILVEVLGSSLSDLQKDSIYKFLIDEDYALYAKAVNTVIFKSNYF